jgi:Actin
MFFENLVVNGLFMLDAPVLSLYSVGKVSGCVIDIGYGKIGAAPSAYILLCLLTHPGCLQIVVPGKGPEVRSNILDGCTVAVAPVSLVQTAFIFVLA